MSSVNIKQTQRVTRQLAITLLTREIEEASNNQLSAILDAAAASGLSKTLPGIFDFIVSDSDPAENR